MECPFKAFARHKECIQGLLASLSKHAESIATQIESPRALEPQIYGELEGNVLRCRELISEARSLADEFGRIELEALAHKARADREGRSFADAHGFHDDVIESWTFDMRHAIRRSRQIIDAAQNIATDIDAFSLHPNNHRHAA